MNLRFTYSIIPVKSFATTRKPESSCMTELLIPLPNRRTSTVLLSLSKAKKDSTSYATAAKEDSSTLIPKTGHGRSCSNRTTRSTPWSSLHRAIKLISVVFTVSGSSTSKAGNSNTSPYWKQRRESSFRPKSAPSFRMPRADYG